MAGPYGTMGIDPKYTEKVTRYAPETARVLSKGYGVPLTPPTARPPLHARIAELAKEIAVAGEIVAETRQAFRYATQAREEAEARFAAAAEALMAAIYEHREGTPEHKPYERER